VKEQILQLDRHDDFTSARDKMGWAQTERVLLVWPRRGRVLTRRLDLVLLHRHAATLGARLGLVTEDSEVREYAGELGLPCFDSVEQGHLLHWRYRKPRAIPIREPNGHTAQRLSEEPLPLPKFPRLKELSHTLDRFIRPAIFVLALTALLAVGLMALPTATITLVPRSQDLTLTLPVIASLEQPTSNGSDQSHSDQTIHLPARELAVEIESTLRIPTSGVVEVPAARAIGTVTFTNIVGQGVRIPRGTGVRTTSGSQARFVTTQEVELPPGRGVSVSVSVQAVDPGPQGNVSAQQINAIDGPLSLQLAVINSAPASGGGVEERRAVTEADQASIREQLLAQLEVSALADLASRLTPTEMLPPDGVAISNILAETYDRFPGEQSDALALTMRIRATGIVLDEILVRDLAFQQLARQISPEIFMVPDSQSYSRVTEPVIDSQGRIVFEVLVAARVALRFNAAQIQLQVRGLPSEEASRRLNAVLPLQNEPVIQVQPEWYPLLPWLPFRIDVFTQMEGR